MSELADHWNRLAWEDFKTAKAMRKAGHYPHCGYFCRQTAEKALKALVAQYCDELQFPPKTHDLVRLAKLSGMATEDTFFEPEYWEFLKLLNPLQIETRNRPMTRAFCRDLLTRTEEFLHWSTQML